MAVSYILPQLPQSISETERSKIWRSRLRFTHSGFTIQVSSLRLYLLVCCWVGYLLAGSGKLAPVFQPASPHIEQIVTGWEEEYEILYPAFLFLVACTNLLAFL